MCVEAGNTVSNFYGQMDLFVRQHGERASTLIVALARQGYCLISGTPEEDCPIQDLF